MESNPPVIAKKAWSMLRVFLFMLKKGISKGKLITHLNMFLKHRRKLAGKAITNLLSHHHHGAAPTSRDPHLQFFSSAREYEFSCSNTPNYTFLPAVLGKRHHRHNPFFACAHAPPTHDDDMAAGTNALKMALEMLKVKDNKDNAAEASPALPGFGRSPMVRQLRVTDSPFPEQDSEDDRDHQVDKAAEEFIKKFYSQLRNQA